ncbi:hypothetical protein YC2023_060853 [Brassica napus]
MDGFWRGEMTDRSVVGWILRDGKGEMKCLREASSISRSIDMECYLYNWAIRNSEFYHLGSDQSEVRGQLFQGK